MTEFELAPGRYLVSANMGEGYEEYNDPSRVRDFYGKVYDSLMREGRQGGGLPYKLEESGVARLRPYIRVPEVKTILGQDNDFVDVEHLERFKTFMLELAFLEGDQAMIDSIIGKENHG